MSEGEAQQSTLDMIAERIAPPVEAEAAPDQPVEAEAQSDAEAPEESQVDADGAVEEGDDESTQDDDAEGAEGTGDDDGDGAALSLADYLGISDDQIIAGDDGEILISTKVDGKYENVNIKQLVKDYQLQSHTQRQLQEHAEQRKQFEAFKAEQQQQLQHELHQAQSLTGVMEQQLLSEYNSVNWEQLRAEDPGRFAAMRQEYSDRANQIQQAKGTIAQQAEQAAQQQQQEVAQKVAEYRQQAVDEILAKNPEWRDDAVRAKAMDGIQDFLTSTYGFGESDMQYVVDPKLMDLVQDAMKYRQGSQQAAQKKSVSAPRFQKPGRPQKSAKQKKQEAARRRLAQTGSSQDARQVIFDRISVT